MSEGPQKNGFTDSSVIINKNKRGRYNKITDPVRKIIINLSKHSISVSQIAEICDLSPQTVRSIVRTGMPPHPRGGFRHSKMTDDTVRIIQEFVCEKGNISLKEIQLHLKSKFQKFISLTTLNRKIPDFLYVNKMKGFVMEDINSQENVSRRFQFAFKYSQILPNHQIIFISDVNFHIWSTLHRKQKPKSEYSKYKKYSQKGTGLHVLFVMSSIHGIIFYQVIDIPLIPNTFTELLERINNDLNARDTASRPRALVTDETTLSRSHLAAEICSKFNLTVIYFPPCISCTSPLDFLLERYKSNVSKRFHEMRRIYSEDEIDNELFQKRVDLLINLIDGEYNTIDSTEYKHYLSIFHEIIKKYTNRELIE